MAQRCSRMLRCFMVVAVLALTALPSALGAAQPSRTPHAGGAKPFSGTSHGHRLSKKQRAKLVRQLQREIRRNPRAVGKRSFLRRASLANFRLPVTLVLRTGDVPSTPNVDESATNNPNRASIDLGTSLGTREVDLGGRLAAEIVFSDSYDGGALGNVRIELLPSATKALETTSIPLVWNDRITDGTTRWDANAVNDLIMSGQQVTLPGCGDFDSGTTDVTKALAGNLIFGRGYVPVVGGPGLPGFPLHQANDATNPAPGSQNFDPNNTNIPEGFLPQQSGIDTPSRLKATRNPGDPMALGGNPMPFPVVSSGTAPGGFGQPSVADTALRTAPLSLQVAPVGTEVNMTGITTQGGNPNGVNGAGTIVIGKSGGQANLFGNIPGKPYGIDVTASFATRINSIIRILDQDLTGRNLIEGEPWPAGVFGCRQVYTGFVDNYVPSVHLRGSLKIAPAVTSDGHLRIAKATVSSQTPTRFPVAACVVPMSSFQKPNAAQGENRSDAPAGSYTEYDDNLPSPFSAGAVLQPLDPLLFPQYTGGMMSLSELPVDTNTMRDRPPARPCNTPADRLVQLSAMPPYTVGTYGDAIQGDPDVTTGNGSTITVSADLHVQQVSLDVLIGDVPEPPTPQGQPDGGLKILTGLLDPILALLPPIVLPPVVPSLPTVPTTTPTVPTTTVPSVTTTVPSVTVPSVTTPTETTTTPAITTTVPSTTVGDVTTPAVTTTIPSVTTTVPEVTTPVLTTPTVGVTTPTLTTPTVTVPTLPLPLSTSTRTQTLSAEKASMYIATLDPSAKTTASSTPSEPVVAVEAEPSVFETPVTDPVGALLAG